MERIKIEAAKVLELEKENAAKVMGSLMDDIVALKKEIEEAEKTRKT